MRYCFKVQFQDACDVRAETYSLYGSATNACNAAISHCENNIPDWLAVRDAAKKVRETGHVFIASTNSERCATVTYEEIL